MLYVGLISGTSADAVDAALVRVGESVRELELVAYRASPLAEDLRARVHGAGSGTLALRDLLRLDRELGERFAAAALDLLRDAGVEASEVRAIGSHGQTVAHHPESQVRGTLQLGSAAEIHERTGVRVISDFRSADLAAGGQGAPLTPYLHHARFASEHERRAVLNIGGFTNVTYLPDTDPAHVVAFDPGPGNALLDRAARWASEGRDRYDAGGERARRGRADPALVQRLLEDAYFELEPPKSTGHEHFDDEFFRSALEHSTAAAAAAGGGPDDLMATLLELTVESVARSAERFFPRPPERWLVCGGGVHNPVLLARLERRLAPAAVDTTDAHGVPGDALEAITFATLAWASDHGLPGNIPAATGAHRPVILGSATPPVHAR